MLKNISKLGTILNKEDQKSIKGGWTPCGGSMCCRTLPNGYVLREPCRCFWAGCILL
ncbi:hypothetical protein [Tenacibaculum agarivorans]|uniref:hypothetical protein n=1 Tax=Tenacibaculum agarivorans TaxID=1908389 RepID=UPI000A50E059|nr:hypothetical protein [Tenacibaculum agarivorans]